MSATLKAKPDPFANLPKLGRLGSLGVHCLRDAALLLPKGYLDLRGSAVKGDFALLPVGEKVVLRCFGMGAVDTRFDRKPVRTVFKVADARRQEVSATVFGDARRLLTALRERAGQGCFYLRGEVSEWNGQLQMANPQLVDPDWIGSVKPVYPGKAAIITPETVAERLQALLPLAVPEAADWLAGERLGWDSHTEARWANAVPAQTHRHDTLESLLREVHHPATPKSGEAAVAFLKRLATLDVVVRARRAAVREPAPGCQIEVGEGLLEGMLAEIAHQIKATGEQRQVISEICADLNRQRPMHRLLSADVGYGKTLVAGCVAV